MGEIAKTKSQYEAVKAFLEHPNVLSQVGKVMPGEDPRKLIRQALNQCQQNQDLMKCSPLSLAMAIMKAAEMRLDLSPSLGLAYIVPRYSSAKRCMEAAFQIGWKGYISLAFRTGIVSSMPVKIVHENDDFEIDYGTKPGMKHKPAKGDRGVPIGYYCIVIYKDGGVDFEYMTKDEVRAHSKRFSKKHDSGPWVTDFDAMAVKTVVIKLCRRLALGVGESERQYYEECPPEPQEVKVERAEDEKAFDRDDSGTHSVTPEVSSND